MPGFAEAATANIAKITSLPFATAPNKFPFVASALAVALG